MSLFTEETIGQGSQGSVFKEFKQRLHLSVAALTFKLMDIFSKVYKKVQDSGLCVS